MVRRRACAVSNHEAPIVILGAILRNAAFAAPWDEVATLGMHTPDALAFTGNSKIQSKMSSRQKLPQGMDTTMKSPICDMLGIEFPLLAFSHCRDVVAAVSRAGGFGVLGALAFTPDELEIELAWIDDHCDGKPYGVDLVMPANYVGKGGVQPSAEELRAMIPQ